MSYLHLTINERESILKLSATGHSVRSIAYHLGKSPSTISRELKRCLKDYSPAKAQKDYLHKRKSCHKPVILEQDQNLCELIARLIEDSNWSPQ